MRYKLLDYKRSVAHTTHDYEEKVPPLITWKGRAFILVSLKSEDSIAIYEERIVKNL